MKKSYYILFEHDSLFAMTVTNNRQKYAKFYMFSKGYSTINQQK